MKKTLLLMVAVFLTISAMGQSRNEKNQISAIQEQLKSGKLQSILSSGEKLDSTISELWNETTSDWTLKSRKKYSYTVNGNMSTAIGSEKNAGSGFIWEYADKTETTDDANGNTTLETTFSWNKTTSQWVAGMKMEFTFNATNDLTSNSTYMWNPGLNAWFGLFKTEYTIGDNSNWISDMGYRWDFLTSAWLESDKTEYTYTDGKMTLELSFDWDDVTSEWINSGKTELTYTNGNISMDISYDWDASISDWINENKTEYTYTDGKMTMGIEYDWDAIANDWVYSSKTEINFDANGEMIRYSFYSWDKTTSLWIGEMETRTSFGQTSGEINYNISTSYLWDKPTADWVPAGRSTSYYSDQTSSFNDFSKNEIRVYPNPATDFLRFDLPDQAESSFVQIYDIQGKKIMEQKITNNQPLSISGLHKGLYIYQLQVKGTITKGKFLIK